MKIVDLRCAVIGRHPIVRIVTDENIHGLGEVEFTKPYLKPLVLHFREALIGEDPTDVERVHAARSASAAAFKPYGAAVSAIEHALVGHCRQGRGRSRLQAARRQGARPGALLQRQQAPQAHRRPARRLCRRRQMDDGAARGLLHGEAGHHVPLQHEGLRFPTSTTAPCRGRPATTAPWTRARSANAAWPMRSTASRR